MPFKTISDWKINSRQKLFSVTWLPINQRFNQYFTSSLFKYVKINVQATKTKFSDKKERQEQTSKIVTSSWIISRKNHCWRKQSVLHWMYYNKVPEKQKIWIISLVLFLFPLRFFVFSFFLFIYINFSCFTLI